MLVIVIAIFILVVILSRTLNEDHTIKQEKKRADSWKGAFAAYDKAFGNMLNNPGPAVLFLVTYAVAIALSSLFQEKNFMQPGYISYESVVGLLFILGLPVYNLAIADGRKISIREFTKFSPKRYFLVLLTSILVGLITIFSTIPLAIPLIWTYAWFFVAVYAVVDKDMNPFNALRYSKALTENHKSKVWGLLGAGIVIGIASVLLVFVPTLGVYLLQFSILALSMLASASSAILYRWLQNEASK